MNRTVVSGIAAFALTIGAALAMTESTAEAGHCGGGLFARLHARQCGGGLLGGGHLFKHGCGGGLLARLRARHASSCCAPEPACCEPAPAPCDTGCGAVASDCGGCGAVASDCGGCGAVASDCGGCGGAVASDCGGCGGSVVVGCAGAGCGGEVIMETVIEGELVAPVSSSDAPVEAAPPAPAPDAQTDA